MSGAATSLHKKYDKSEVEDRVTTGKGTRMDVGGEGKKKWQECANGKEPGELGKRIPLFGHGMR